MSLDHPLSTASASKRVGSLVSALSSPGSCLDGWNSCVFGRFINKN